MKSPTNQLRQKYKEDILRASKSGSNKKTNKEKEDNAIEWITLFRRNWHIYADMILGIKLKPFQMIMIYLMGVSDVFFAICSRGLSKTFMAGLGAIIKMLLYPYSEVVVTASTIPQANIIVDDKIRGELIVKLSPYLLYLYERDYLKITRSDEGYVIECTLNGSTLRVLPCLDSSRGHRSTFTIYEECRLLKKNLIDSVFDKMAHPRQAKYLDNSEYANNPRWLEECKYVYITSARYKYEWFWRQFKKCVTGYYSDKHVKYNIFAGDIFMSIENGLKTWGDFRKAKKMSGEMDFRMEDLNEMIGEAEDAFFNYQNFKENQTIKQCFRPPTIMDIYMGKDLSNKKKKDTELRFVGVDYAFANTTGKEKNDNTIIVCMSAHWKNNKFERHIDYMEGHSASDSLGAADRARELFWDYDADILIPDLRSGGEVLYNRMTTPWEHPTRGARFDSRGLTVSDKPWAHVASEGKLTDLRDRTVDKNALPAIVPFIGTSELNSIAWVELRKQTESNNIKLLVTAQQHQEDLEDSGEYFKLTSEELVNELLPYGQVDEAVQELVNLKTELKNDKIKLVEPRSGTKDRAVIISYVNYIISLFENQWQKMAQEEEINIDEIELVW